MPTVLPQGQSREGQRILSFHPSPAVRMGRHLHNCSPDISIFFAGVLSRASASLAPQNVGPYDAEVISRVHSALLWTRRAFNRVVWPRFPAVEDLEATLSYDISVTSCKWAGETL